MRGQRWLDRGQRWWWVAALALVSSFVSLHPLPAADNDVFWHLTIGRAVLEQHTRVLLEPTALGAFTDRCIAAEWLWEVMTWLGWRAGGFVALSWLLALCGLLMALTTARLSTQVRAVAGAASFGAPLVVSALALTVLLSRLLLRPHAAYLILLPLFVALCFEVMRASARRKRMLGATLVVLTVLWAQLHGSFILAPLVFLVVAATDDSVRDAAARRAHLVVLLGLGAALLTSAHGPSILVYVLEHSGGDAVRHVDDMRAPSWATLNPSQPDALGWWCLQALALGGIIAARRVWWTGAALWALGAALFATALRFVDAATILTIPLAIRGADELATLLRPHRGWRTAWLAPATVSILFFWLSSSVDSWWGPLGRPGLDESRIPAVAAAWLLRAPPTAVLSSYGGTAPLGFALHGRDRTFVDGRTPLYFDATDYAVAREIWYDARGLELGIARYGFGAVVAPRESAMCRALAGRWQPVTVESGFTTFVPPGHPERLLSLAPCGDDLLAGASCNDFDRATAELERLRSLHASPLWALLSADLAARCQRPATPLPSRADAWPYTRAWRLAAIRIAVAAGHADEAAGLAAPLTAQGNVGALALLRPVYGALPPSTLRALFDSVTDALDDRTPPQLRADLAKLCTATGDAECVRFNALRAAARGVAAARQPLEWLVQHHPAARVQADARAWLATLPEHEAPPTPKEIP